MVTLVVVCVPSCQLQAGAACDLWARTQSNEWEANQKKNRLVNGRPSVIIKSGVANSRCATTWIRQNSLQYFFFNILTASATLESLHSLCESSAWSRAWCTGEHLYSKIVNFRAFILDKTLTNATYSIPILHPYISALKWNIYKEPVSGTYMSYVHCTIHIYLCMTVCMCVCVTITTCAHTTPVQQRRLGLKFFRNESWVPRN